MLRRGLPRIGRAEPQNKEDEVVVPDPFKKGTIIAARENLPAVAYRSRLVKQGGEITSGVHYVAAPGHSPSHASILLTSGKEQFVYMGDIAHNPVTSLQHTDWTPGLRLRARAGDQVAQGHPGPRRDRSGHGDGLSFSVPRYWTCRPARHGIPLGSRPVGVVAATPGLLSDPRPVCNLQLTYRSVTL